MEGKMWRLLEDEPWEEVLSVCIFSLPALGYAAKFVVPIPSRLLLILTVCILLGPVLYGWLTRSEDHAPRTGGTNQNMDFKPTKIDLELVAANYHRLNDQAKYRDKLLINSNYFSLAIIAVLVNVFLSANPKLRPLIAMTGAVTAYAFWLATRSYKGTRDAINNKLRTIEEEQYPELKVVSTYDSRGRTLVGKRSLSSYLVGIQITATIIWWVIYLGYVLYLGCT